MFGPKARQYLSKSFSVILLLGCSIFVLFKGYECFKKFLKKHEGSRIEYVFAGSLPFPAITFCPINVPHSLPKPYDEKVMKVCNLTPGEYPKKGPWIGTGSPHCTDPEIFRDLVTVQLKDMRINDIVIKTFSNLYNVSNILNTTLVDWERNYGTPHSYPCHTMKISKDVAKEGIKSINFGIQSNSISTFGIPKDKTTFLLFVHDVGLLQADLPSASPNMNFYAATFAPVEIEVVDLLQYNGQPCKRDKNYRWDHCRQNLIYTVSEIATVTKKNFTLEIAQSPMCPSTQAPKNLINTVSEIAQSPKAPKPPKRPSPQASKPPYVQTPERPRI